MLCVEIVEEKEHSKELGLCESLIVTDICWTSPADDSDIFFNNF